MIILDSVGFAGTHSLTNILSSIENTHVAHGSQNFITRGPMGEQNAPLDQFLEDMKKIHSEGKVSIAVHCRFPPEAAFKLSQSKGVEYKVLVRDPEQQIMSCYSWALKKILDGDAASFLKSVEALQNIIIGANLKPTFQNAVAAFAVSHVVGYNLMALASGCKIIQMESVLNNKDEFLSTFGFKENLPLDHFDRKQVHLASHKSKTGAQWMGEPDLEAILNSLQLSLSGRPISWQSYKSLLGY